VTPIYPFSAIVGHDRLRLALVLCAVRPEIGGVLIRGEKGTAKSTAVRGLAAVLSAVDQDSALVELRGVVDPCEHPTSARRISGQNGSVMSTRTQDRSVS